MDPKHLIIIKKFYENGGEGVCRMQIQVIDNDSFSWLCRILPHILPHIKIRVTEGVS